uniref:Uncharacterized protein n=1 Tax=Cacopsylla melanoneura TaxID=428564 RepID=A0A8D8Q5T7_9HEMI
MFLDPFKDHSTGQFARQGFFVTDTILRTTPTTIWNRYITMQVLAPELQLPFRCVHQLQSTIDGSPPRGDGPDAASVKADITTTARTKINTTFILKHNWIFF